MTPLKPVENTTQVRGVPSKRYPLNTVCAHPECDRTDVTAHHIFGRPPGPDSDSWFVQLGLGESSPLIIPHVTGLCGHGTEGHHGDVEAHRGWIKLEDEMFVWYDRGEQELIPDWNNPQVELAEYFQCFGPLNPQPGSCEGRPKRKKRKPSEGPRLVWSMRAPADDPELVERVRGKVEQLQEKMGGEIGPSVTIERSLDYTLLNADSSDF